VISLGNNQDNTNQTMGGVPVSTGVPPTTPTDLPGSGITAVVGEDSSQVAPVVQAPVEPVATPAPSAVEPAPMENPTPTPIGGAVSGVDATSGNTGTGAV